MTNRSFFPLAALLLAATLVLNACNEAPTIPEPQAEAPASSLFQEGDPVVAPSASKTNQFPCAGGETVLLIQDNVPWFDPGFPHGMGANVEELIQQQKNFCVITSSQIGATNLALYGVVIISGAQTQAFYDNLFPGGVVHPSVSAYVQGGGILSAFLSDFASGPGAGGNWSGDTFVGGVTHTTAFDQNNNIAAPAHPIITDALPCPGGNCAPIVDAGTHNDLDNWNSSNHGFFTNLPGGTTVILVDSQNQPVMVEYPFGNGTVIATMTTTEWRYVGNFGGLPQNKKLTANDIAYQCARAVIQVDIDIKPGSFPNSINTKSKGNIPVAVLGSATFDVNDIDRTTLAFGPAGATPVHNDLGHLEDVNNDGFTDLVSHYRTKDTGLAPGDTQACVTGQTTGGQNFEGCDSVRIVK